jgi:hypothetical protein
MEDDIVDMDDLAADTVNKAIVQNKIITHNRQKYASSNLKLDHTKKDTSNGKTRISQ